jgi:hypothetical protein
MSNNQEKTRLENLLNDLSDEFKLLSELKQHLVKTIAYEGFICRKECFNNNLLTCSLFQRELHLNEDNLELRCEECFRYFGK